MRLLVFCLLIIAGNMSKIYIVCNRHDENLLSLVQEALFLGHAVVPYYGSKTPDDLNKLYEMVTTDDRVMILHIGFGSQDLYKVIQKTNCKKFLNANALKHNLIGSKLFQQQQVKNAYPELCIETYTKESLPKDTSLPLIAKPVDGSCGMGVKLITNLDSVSSLPENTIYQRFVVNDGDWRVVVVGGKAISAIKRLGKEGQVTNNIATGSFAISEKNQSVLESIYDVAEKAASCMGFDYVGIDVIKDIQTNNYYFLESNERPTFETSQILTGTNIAKYIIEELVK